MQVTVTGDALAWWGAVVATVLAVIRIIDHIRDRPQIRVEARYGYMTPDITLRFLCLTAANVGKRPVTLNRAMFYLAGGQVMQLLPQSFLIDSDQLPGRIEEGDSCTVNVSYEMVKETAEESGSQVLAAGFQDAAGRQYKTRFRLT